MRSGKNFAGGAASHLTPKARLGSADQRVCKFMPGGPMNIGVHHGILEKKHIEKMGQAIWLYLWCLYRQTKPNGLVLGGTPITYTQIHQQLGQARRTIESWMKALRDFGYIEVKYLSYKKMQLRVVKPKKFNFKQLPLAMDEHAKNGAFKQAIHAKNGATYTPKMADTGAENGAFKQSGSIEQIEATTTPLVPVGLAGVIPLPVWRLFGKMRVGIKKPLTDDETDLFVRKLLEFQSEGQDPIAILEQSIMNRWAGIFPVRGTKNGTTKSDERAERTDTALGRVFGKPETVAQNIRRALPTGDH